MKLETDQQRSVLAGHGQTWEGHASCLKETQTEQSLVLLAYLQKCSGFPEGK